MGRRFAIYGVLAAVGIVFFAGVVPASAQAWRRERTRSGVVVLTAWRYHHRSGGAGGIRC